jgi:ATP/maltotriose-dependent transcriptional regulator MalT
MLETSVLSRMTGPLCDAVVGWEGSGALLERLVRSNLFVVPLDDHGGWYRYHHLFAELLIYELKGSRPDLLPVLNARASAWFEGEGMFESAIRHAIAAADHERAGALISRNWFRYAIAGQLASLERWLDVLPADLVERDAPLAMVRARIFAHHGQAEETERWLKLARSIPYSGQLLERQQRELGQRKQKEPTQNGELTDRELAVLRLFDGDLSHRQIGESLYVSINTIKTHVKSIYRKLGVSSREEALQIARERALI